MDLVIGNGGKLNVLDYVRLGKNEKPLIIRDRITKEDFSIHFMGDFPFEKRANLKIQDGCSFVCSFCIIPKARGPARSRDMKNLLAEARHMARRGIREIVLTGVNLGTFQSREGNLIDVLDRLNTIQGIDRIRISSIEPTTIPTDLFERMNDPGHALLPFLHIPLQAGSDKVLQSMRRRYHLQEYLDFLYQAHQSVADLCLGTDIMVGYPTETESEFEETCRTFSEAPFAYCHVFTFSERDGTPAARLEEGNEVAVKQSRSARLRRLSESKRYRFYESHVGREMSVLFEDPKAGVWPGYTDNYVRVVVESPHDLHNQICRVSLDRVAGEVVEGSLIKILPNQRVANQLQEAMV